MACPDSILGTGRGLKKGNTDTFFLTSSTVPDPVLFEPPVVIYLDGDLIPFFKTPQPVVIHFLHMAEVVASEVVLQVFEELDLLREKRILILLYLTGDNEALLIRDGSVIFPVQVQPGELPPVHRTLFIGFTVEHVRVHAADGKPVIIDTAFALFQKPAGPGTIVLCTQGIPRDIKCPVLVAELRRRGRLKCTGIHGFYCRYIAVEQEYMSVELPGAALCAGCAAETYLPDYAGETFHRIFKETVALLRQCSDTERYGG